MTGRTLAVSARASANTIGTFAAAALLITSASAAFALSESPAAISSPAASSAPAPSSAAPPMAPSTVVPSDESEPSGAPSEAGAAGAPSATPPKSATHHKAAGPVEVEPAEARLRVTQDGWIYTAPAKSSKKIEKATIGKFVNVTGSTKYYLQVQLKSGATGYIEPSNVELVKPIDKVFVLTQDAGVLEAPNRWARKRAEVHRTHSVHVVGIALSYMKIRMKSGLEGFIPASALQ
jgi:hypothetical protein